MVQGEYSSTYKKLIYATVGENPLRTTQTYQQHLETVSITGKPSFGVKGPTTLSKLIRIPENIPFDPMHLLYLGINKSFLNAIIKHKLVNLEIMSSVIERIKVPHYFRRKPRNFLTEYGLWKAQEHRHFLLYFAPIVLDGVRRMCPTEKSNHLFRLYYLLSTAIYLLYGEKIQDSDITASEICLREFHLRIIDLFGESIKTITLHALQHLPEQVKKFGPLHCVSAMPFENFNRQLKMSVTGTRGAASTMVYRYLNFQSHLEKNNSASIPTVLGKSFPFQRFKIGSLVFHTFHHGKSLLSASYFAFLATSAVFVKIKSINFISDQYFSVVCRSYKCKPLKSVTDCSDMPSSVSDTLLQKSPFYILTKGAISEYCPTEFSHHAIITQCSGLLYGVKILNSFEHE